MRKLWYLAHPVAPDDQYTTEQNLDHALRCMRAVWDAGLLVIAPWHTHCLFLDDTNQDHRSLGLLCNSMIIRQCGGVILTGHRFSSGMQKEIRVARMARVPIIDLVGMPSGEITEHLRTYGSTIEEARAKASVR